MSKKGDSEEVKAEMIQYLEAKYGSDYEILNFEYALRGLDANRNDALKVRMSNGVEFYVYHYTGEGSAPKIYDDYIEGYVDKLFYDKFGQMPEFSKYTFFQTAAVRWGEKSRDDIDRIVQLPLDEILDDYQLLGITMVITFTEPGMSISDEIEGLYECYKKASTIYDMKAIHFEVIHYSGNEQKLQDTIYDIRKNYDNNWKTYSTIDQYLSVSEFGLTLEEFTQKIVEK